MLMPKPGTKAPPEGSHDHREQRAFNGDAAAKLKVTAGLLTALQNRLALQPVSGTTDAYRIAGL